MGVVTGTTAAIIGLMAAGTATAAYGANRQTKAMKQQTNVARDAAKANIAIQESAMARDKAAADALAAAPAVAATKAQQATIKRRKASARTQSVRTSPLGLGGEADVARKKLLGQ